MPKISVIIPVYNADEYLRLCLNSVVSQSDFDLIEVLIVDDGSTDGSGRICDEFADKYKNIYVFHIPNSGVSHARNEGIKKSSGDYIMFCDADDNFSEGIFSKVIAAADKENPDLVFWNYIYETERNEKKTDFPFKENTLMSGNELKNKVSDFMLSDYSFNNVWNKAFKRSVIAENGIEFTVGKKYGEDREFVLKFLAKCGSGVFIKDCGYFYRSTQSGAIRRERTDFFDNLWDGYLSDCELYRSFYPEGDSAVKKCSEALPKHIIEDVFYIYENYDKNVLKRSLESLYLNNDMMRLVNEYACRTECDNALYQSIAQRLYEKNTDSVIRLFMKYKAKEKIYRLLKG